MIHLSEMAAAQGGTHRSAHHAHRFTTFATATALVAAAAEDVEAVDEMEHDVGIDGVVPRVATHRGRECT